MGILRKNEMLMLPNFDYDKRPHQADPSCDVEGLRSQVARAAVARVLCASDMSGENESYTGKFRYVVRGEKLMRM